MFSKHFIRIVFVIARCQVYDAVSYYDGIKIIRNT